MNFSGFVAFRRGFLDHIREGKLSNTEALVLFTLILLADSKSGRGAINAAAIRAFLPELKYETAKRVLKELEDRRYIWREITHASKALYPYWINHYAVSQGPYNSFQIDLSQVFESRDIRDIRYVKPVPAHTPHKALDDTPHNTPQDIPDDAPNNNKDNNKDKDKNKEKSPVIEPYEMASSNASIEHSEDIKDASRSTHEASADAIAMPSSNASLIASPDASSLASLEASSIQGATRDLPKPHMMTPRPAPADCGMVLKKDLYFDAQTGEFIPTHEALKKITELQVEWNKQGRKVPVEIVRVTKETYGSIR